MKIFFKNKDEIRTFSDIKKKKRLDHQPTCTVRNSKGSPSSKRKTIPNGNLNPHKGIKSSRNGNYMYKYKDFFLGRDVSKMME